MSDGDSVVLYADDPGAANFIAALASGLRDHGITPLIFGDAIGAQQLGSLGASYSDGVGAASALDGAVGLVVGTSENLNTRSGLLVSLAQNRGIPSFGVVDAPSFAVERFLDEAGRLKIMPDWVLVPDEASRLALLESGIDAARVVVVGHPHFDYVANARQDLECIGAKKLRQRLFPEAAGLPIIVFLAEISDGLKPHSFRRSADYTLDGWGDDDRRTHVVLQELIDAIEALGLDCFKVLRLHPKNDEDEFGRYLEWFDRVSKDETALEVVFTADIVTGMSTILLAEAAILGRPVLAILPREVERDWLPAEAAKHIACVTQPEQIGPAIEAQLSTPQIWQPEPNAAERAAAFLAAHIPVTTRVTSQC